MKIAFFGTPLFAADILKWILDFSDIQVDLVVSQPDKPVGRKQELLQTPVKEIALQNRIRVLQPERLRSNPFFVEELKSLELDFIVVVAYGKLIPQKILDASKYGCINIHGSILPLYRGASPVQSAIKNGDKETGLTIMYMNQKMDEGDILQIEKVQIDDDDTSLDVFQKFIQIGPKLLADTLRKVKNGELPWTPQNHSEATYCHMIEKEDGEVNFTQLSSQQIYNIYRAFQPWPGIYIFIDRKKLWLEKISLSDFKGNTPGSFIKIDKRNYGVVCADKKVLLLHQVKPEWKKSMDIGSYVNGNREYLNIETI